MCKNTTKICILCKNFTVRLVNRLTIALWIIVMTESIFEKEAEEFFVFNWDPYSFNYESWVR